MIDKLILEDNIKISKYIIRLIIFVNKYFKYDMVYIQQKYNYNSYIEFANYFKKNYKIKLLFSSNESELLFINFINIDYNFLIEKYNNHAITLINFFTLRKKFYFNLCNYHKKHVKDLCNCKIKVKSIVNLSIDSFIFILKEYFKNEYSNKSKFLENNIIEKKILSDIFPLNKFNIDSQKKSNCSKIIKMKNNNNSKDLLKCFNNLEKANNNLGSNIIENHYTLDSLSDNLNINNLEKKNNSNHNLYKKQFSSESIIFCDNQNKYIEKNIFLNNNKILSEPIKLNNLLSEKTLKQSALYILFFSIVIINFQNYKYMFLFLKSFNCVSIKE